MHTHTHTQIPNLEVWFQRASDVVRKLRYGDIDLGIVGYDMFAELADDDEDLIVVHDALDFGQVRPCVSTPGHPLCSQPLFNPGAKASP